MRNFFVKSKLDDHFVDCEKGFKNLKKKKKFYVKYLNICISYGADLISSRSCASVTSTQLVLFIIDGEKEVVS